jgi:hypothetical protein
MKKILITEAYCHSSFVQTLTERRQRNNMLDNYFTAKKNIVEIAGSSIFWNGTTHDTCSPFCRSRWDLQLVYRFTGALSKLY